jgi:hypothetical protein
VDREVPEQLLAPEGRGAQLVERAADEVLEDVLRRARVDDDHPVGRAQ